MFFGSLREDTGYLIYNVLIPRYSGVNREWIFKIRSSITLHIDVVPWFNELKVIMKVGRFLDCSSYKPYARLVYSDVSQGGLSGI